MQHLLWFTAITLIKSTCVTWLFYLSQTIELSEAIKMAHACWGGELKSAGRESGRSFIDADTSVILIMQHVKTSFDAVPEAKMSPYVSSTAFPFSAGHHELHASKANPAGKPPIIMVILYEVTSLRAKTFHSLELTSNRGWASTELTGLTHQRALHTRRNKLPRTVRKKGNPTNVHHTLLKSCTFYRNIYQT